MAELLVRLIDKRGDDPYLDCKLTRRGDVILVAEDGHEWGTEELANAAWRLVKVPGVSVAGLSWLMAPELDIDPHNPSRMLQARAFSFKPDASPTTYAELVAATARKTPLRDPNVID